MIKNMLIRITCVLFVVALFCGCGAGPAQTDVIDKSGQHGETAQENEASLDEKATDDADLFREDDQEYSDNIQEPVSDLSADDALEIADNLGGQVAAIELRDYDGNGGNEAFVILGNKDEFGGYLADSLWFISSEQETSMLRDDFDNLSMYTENDGFYMEYEREDIGFFYADFGAYGSGWTTLICSVRDGKPYELDISMDTEGFYQDVPGEFYTLTDNFDDGHAYLRTPLSYDTGTGQFIKGEPIYESDAPETDTEARTEETIPEYFVYVSSSDGYANLRTGPGTENDIICQIPTGEALEVYREDATDAKGRKWLKVAYYRETDNEDGYEWITGWIAESQVD